MKLAVLSDTHGDEFAIRRFARRLPEDVACVAHLGDVTSDASLLARLITVPIYCVRGNCDMFSGSAPEERLEVLLGIRAFLCHGHRYQVKHTNALLVDRAAALGAQLALYGHTHRALCAWERGVLTLNPGSLRDGGRYALIEVEDGRMRPDLLSL